MPLIAEEMNQQGTNRIQSVFCVKGNNWICYDCLQEQSSSCSFVKSIIKCNHKLIMCLDLRLTNYIFKSDTDLLGERNQKPFG
jgi:hypothetical protein